MYSFEEITYAAKVTESFGFIKEVRVLPIRTSQKAEVWIEIVFDKKGYERTQKRLKFKVGTPGKRTCPEHLSMRMNDPHNWPAHLELMKTQWDNIPLHKGFHAVSWELYEVVLDRGDKTIKKEKSTDPFTTLMVSLRLGLDEPLEVVPA